MLCDKVDYGKRVACYRNLHFPNTMWSIKSMQSGDDYGLVIAHSPEAFMTDCTFHVSVAGRGRVLSEKRKNVHASVRGFWAEPFTCRVEDIGTPITYNPYKYGTFVTVKDERPVTGAERVMLCETGPMAWGLSYAD